MGESPIYVLKVGSSVLPNKESLPEAVHEIYRRLREGFRVIAVVSALGSTTDELLTEAQSFGNGPGNEPAANAVATLVATGESRAVALLTLALGRAGIPARALDAAGIGLTTEGPLLDSRTSGLDTTSIRRSLTETPVLVVPGFLGRAPDGSISLLGRGGSDLTALYLATELRARCTLVKDVDGLYDRDPAGTDGAAARRFEHVHYDDVLALSEGIVQHKAVRYAAESGLEFEVSCCGGVRGTIVGKAGSRLAESLPLPAPLRVAILGMGTVGRGVYDDLARQSDRFSITGALVRDVEKHILTGIPGKLLTQEGKSLLSGTDADLPNIVVETLGGIEPAATLVQLALERGVHVVTANKQLIAEHGDELNAIGRATGARLLYSASVGGAVPMLETVERLRSRGIRRIEGVINGTTNYILNQVAVGLTFHAALREAQTLGFAEADPTDDIDGIDAGRKLVLLCRAAWGIHVTFPDVDICGIREVRGAIDSSGHVRLVASAEFVGDRVNASVRPKRIPHEHPLAKLPGATNSLLVTCSDGEQVVVAGLAAGRWPTTESVVADVLQIRREEALHECESNGGVFTAKAVLA